MSYYNKISGYCLTKPNSAQHRVISSTRMSSARNLWLFLKLQSLLFILAIDFCQKHWRSKSGQAQKLVTMWHSVRQWRRYCNVQENLLLLATVYIRADQAYRSYRMLKGKLIATQMSVTCYQSISSDAIASAKQAPSQEPGAMRYVIKVRHPNLSRL